jgi:hypothetical protein
MAEQKLNMEIPMLAELLVKLRAEREAPAAISVEQNKPLPIFAIFPVNVTPVTLKLAAPKNTPPACSPVDYVTLYKHALLEKLPVQLEWQMPATLRVEHRTHEVAWSQLNMSWGLHKGSMEFCGRMYICLGKHVFNTKNESRHFGKNICGRTWNAGNVPGATSRL